MPAGKETFSFFFCQETKVGESDWHIIGGGGVAVEVGDGGVISYTSIICGIFIHFNLFVFLLCYKFSTNPL